MTLEDLLMNMFYAAPEIWYALAVVFLFLLVGLIYLALTSLRLKQKIYFLNRDRERYAETLYASKDGYFAFIYPDQKVNDPRQHVRERCSRRLAVILNLELGGEASFEDILKKFHKDDIKRIRKYIELLTGEGVSFEDKFVLKNNNRHISLSGSRISGVDGNIYCDIIWFRDISFESLSISRLMKQNNELGDSLSQLESLIDNIAYPAWLRDENLKLVGVNKKYLDFVSAKNKEEVVKKGLEILSVGGESVSKNLAFLALSGNKTKSHKVNVTVAGKMVSFEVIETPFYKGDSLEKICTVGSMVDISELDSLKRNQKAYQNAHLEILEMLGTAFAVFGKDFKLVFYNQAFRSLWGLDKVWLESQPTYSAFLDAIRSNRALPEVSDFTQYKEEELKFFSSIIGPKEDLLHLPSEKTLRRLRAPHPSGGLIFAFEDVSDNLATRRAYATLQAVHDDVLQSISDALLIFDEAGCLSFYNKAYITLWKARESVLKKGPTISEIIDSQKKLIAEVEDFDRLKAEILKYIASITTRTFRLERNDGTSIEVRSQKLPDGTMMISYH